MTGMPIRFVSILLLALTFALPAGSRAEPIDLRASSRVQQKLDSAIAELGKGNLKQADAMLQELLKEDPTHVYALLAQGANRHRTRVG